MSNEPDAIEAVEIDIDAVFRLISALHRIGPRPLAELVIDLLQDADHPREVLAGYARIARLTRCWSEHLRRAA